jgi:Mrp family chromosome partitioning ATPase/capsular polysaccharide biosynthesis protein
MKRHSLAIDRYLEILVRRKWALIIPLAMTLVAAAVIVYRQPNSPKDYEATSLVRLALAGRPTGASVSPADTAVIANTANYVLESDAALNRVADSLGLDTSPARLRGMFTIVPVTDTEFIELHARGDSPEAAANLANALATEWPRSSAEFYSSLQRPDLAQSFVFFQGAAPGTATEAAFSLNSGWATRVVAALAMGVIGGLGIVFLTEYTDRTINTVQGVSAASRTPVLSAIPWLPGVNRRRLWRRLPRRPVSAELTRGRGMRAFTVQMMYLVRAQRLRSVLFTSIWPGDGTTSIVSNTARTLAGDEFDVMLVDGNLENPAIHHALELASIRPGLTDVLASSAAGRGLEVALGKAAQESGKPGLRVLAAGTPTSDAWSVLASSEMRRLVQLHNQDEERDRPELMLIDGPPIVTSASALTLASVVGGVVVVCAEGSGTTEDLQRGLNQLDRLGANVLGIVYNKARTASSSELSLDDRSSLAQQNGHNAGRMMDADDVVR